MTEIVQKELFQITIKSKTEAIEHDIEANYSIEKDFLELPEANNDLESQNKLHKNAQVDSNQKMSEKTGFIRDHSWHDIQAYIRSLTDHSLENLESYISTFVDISEGHGLENNTISKKKWAIYDLVKLGLNEEQIKEAIKHLDTISDQMTKEDMIKCLIEKIFVMQKNNGKQMDIKSIDDVRLELDSSKVNIPSWRSPPPPPNLVLEENSKKQLNVQAETARINLKDIKAAKKSNDDVDDPFPKFECPICYNLFPENVFHSLLKCGHSFCKQCYKIYLHEQIQADRILNIKCPYDGCHEKFPDECILQFLDEKEAIRYKQLKKNALLNHNPNLKWCVRPGCEKYVIGQKGIRKLACECGSEICFKCGNAYHPRKSCNAIIDNVYQKYARDNNVQNCPQCRSRIEKIEGCNHITCSICEYQWCWLCRRKYTNDHFSRSNTHGCPGLQNADQRPPTPSKWKHRTKQVLRIIGTGLLLFMAILLMLPFLLIYMVVNEIFMSKPKSRRNQPQWRWR